MRRSFTVLLVALCLIGKVSADDDKDLIIDGINGRTPTTTTQSPNLVKFQNVTNLAELKAAFERISVTVTTLKQNINTEEKKKHIILNKVQATESMMMLNATKIMMADQKLCLVLLKDRAISLENKISHDNWVVEIGRINDLALDLKDEFDALLELVHHMDCKLKKICFDKSAAEAKEKLFHKINDLGDLTQMCSVFSIDCVTMLKESRKMFEEFQNKTIKELRGQLKVLDERGCIKKAQIHLSEANLQSMEFHAQSWINTIVSLMKVLVDQQLDVLSDLLKRTCAVISEQKLKAKDMKNMDDKLNEVETDLKKELKTAKMISETFAEVYEMLLHLKGVVPKAEFDKCYNKASEIFYLATGFEDQVEDCIAQVQKQRVILGFNTKLSNFEGLFKNRTTAFVSNLEQLVQLGQSGICTNITARRTVFETDKNHLAMSVVEFTGIQTTELPKLKECEEFDEITAKVAGLIVDAKKYQSNSEQQFCFIDLYNTRFC